MKRTMIEVPMRTNNVDEVLRIIAMILEPAGYQRKMVDGETVWAKGDGVMLKMQCFGATFTGSSVWLQGWLKDAVTGESALEGFVAALPKKKMKRLLSQIQTAIIARNL